MTINKTKPLDSHFTDHQWQAVVDEGKNILVSASAGSGKTTVLVQRVIEKIKDFTDINQLLVVTYTNAASREMKERIQKAVQDQINKETDPIKKQHLIRQLPLLGHADISTLHSFCLKVIKRYYYLIDFDPVFRLLTDDTEISLMKEDVWDELREELYGEEDSLLQTVVSTYSNDRSDDGLTDLIFKLFDFSRSKTNSREWLANLSNRYTVENGDLATTPTYIQLAKPAMMDTLESAKDMLEDAMTIGEGEPELEKSMEFLGEEYARFETLEKAIVEDRLTDAFNLFQEPLGRWKGAGKNAEPEIKEAAAEMKSFREKAKQYFTEIKESYFILSPQEQVETMAETKKLIDELARVSVLFFDRYQAFKAERKVLDFNDLEHLTLAILTEEEKGLTIASEASRYYRSQFKEVMVDEYQDINLIQETILKWLTSEQEASGNQFMVGDVKQSIYSFRLADPSLFIDKYERYSSPGTGERIILAENFRSRPEVLDFTNFIFEQLMDKQVGELTYDDSAKLVNGFSAFPESNSFSTEILIYETSEEEQEGTEEEVVEELSGTFDLNTKTKGELYMVAEKINEMMDSEFEIFDKKLNKNRPLQFKDIVLLTPTKKNNIDIQDIFKQVNIPTAVNDTQNYFQTTEIAIMMSVLKIIDNPIQDIPLAAVLRSPIVGLDEVELSRIRIQDKQGSFYDALTAFVRKTDWEDERNRTLHKKLVDFTKKLEEWRTESKRRPLVDLIWTIYEDTGFLHYVGGMSSGRQRKANLHALYDRAAAYERTSFKGLFQFIRFIEKMQKKDKDLAEPSAISDQEDAVRVMTIHASKGLEFPVVFVLDMSKQFNLQDIRGKTILDEEFGVGSQYMDIENRILKPTLPETVLKLEKKKRLLSEQMRVLYVALTRAEQKLFLVGSYKDKKTAVNKWEKVSGHPDKVLPVPLRLDAASFMDWIGRGLIRHETLKDDRSVDATNLDIATYNVAFSVHYSNASELEERLTNLQDETEISWFDELKNGRSLQEQDEAVKETLKQAYELMSHSYAFDLATQTTSYQSVSEIKRLFEEPGDGQMVKIDITAPRRAHRYVEDELPKPSFMTEVLKPSPAEVGKATHLLLQSLDLTEEPTEAHITAKIKQLVKDKIVNKEIAELIIVEKLVYFFQTTFGKRILNHAEKVKREAPFSLLMEARDIFKDIKSVDDHVLIHGIIDGYIELEEGIVLFDYKTDRVEHYGERAADEMLKKYKGQLLLYKQALESILNHQVIETRLILLDTGESILID